MNERRDSIYAVINLGSSYLSGLLAYKGSDGRVEPITAHRIPTHGCIRQGCIHNIEEAARLISLLIDRLSESLPDGASITGVYVGLECRSMHAETYLASIQLGEDGRIVTQDDLKTLEDEVNQAKYSGMEILSVTDPRYRADGKREYTPRGVRCRQLEATYQLVVARQNIITNVEETITKRLGLHLLGIIPTPIAEAVATLTTEESALGCAYVNIGGGTTSIAIYQERLLSALYILPLGGDNITRDLTHLNTRLLESDAELLKLQHGSMNTSVSKTLQIEATSTTGGQSKTFSQLDINRYIDARVREILKNVISIIDEAGFGANVPKGLILAGGVTRTDYFYETLRKLRFEFREARLRRDVYAEGVSPEFVEEYASVIALAWGAKKEGVSYEVLPLETLMEERPEPAFSTIEPSRPSPSTTSGERLEGGYTFHNQTDPLPEEYAGEEEESREESRVQRPSWISRVKDQLTEIFDTGEDD